MIDSATREALIQTIDNGRAHMTFSDLVEQFPLDQINTRPANVPYSFWGLLEHLRICIHLTLDYAVGESFTPLKWPVDFWPADDYIATSEDWDATLASIRAGISEMKRIAADEAIDLAATCRNAGENASDTILFELIDAIDHNAYHVGEFAILRQVMGLWPEDHA